MDTQSAGYFDTNTVPPSPTLWIKHKATIIELYAKSPLKDVQKVMEQRYGFRASKRMYDRRLKDWQCYKYMKAKDKEKLADILLANTGTWVSKTPSPKMRTIEIDDDDYRKVLRHIKSKASRPSTTSSAVTSPRPIPGSSPRRQPQTPNNSSPRARESWGVVSLPTISPKAKSVLECSSIHNGTISSSEVFDIPYAHSNADTDVLDSDLSPASATTKGEVNEECMEYSNPQPFFLAANLASRITEDVQRSQKMGPLRLLTHSSKSLNVEVLLKNVNAYLDHLIQMKQSLFGKGFANPNRPSSEFWSKLKDGIYLYKVQSHELAVPALLEAGDLACTVVANGANLDMWFLREIFLTLSPINTRVFPTLRTLLLQFLRYLICTKVSSEHPLAIIFHELQHDEHDREVSEKALLCMLDTAKAKIGTNDPDGVAFRLQCSIIKLLRRDGDLELAATKARLLFQQSRCSLLEFDAYHTSTDRPPSNDRRNGVFNLLQYQARMAATELAHVLMDQHEPYRAEAIQMSLYVIFGESKLWSVELRESGGVTLLEEIPESAIVQDQASVYAMEDLAKIYEELADLNIALQWLEKARALAERVLGPHDESTTRAHIFEKINDLTTKLRKM